MPRPPRSEQFRADTLGICHLIQRTCRRAWLCGADPLSGRSFEHRRTWIKRRLELLASVFAVDVLTYAVLSNHLHLVLRNRPDVAAAWSDREVALRWLRLFPGRRLEELLAEPTEAQVETLVHDPQRLAEVRLRLSDPSWFMRALAEPIARMANREDECTGRFWEGRFKAQALADEAAVLACSMYVDLNPIRAAIAERIEDYAHTSAYDRQAAQAGATIRSAAGELEAISSSEAADARKHTPRETLEAKVRARRRGSGVQVPADAWLAPLALGQSALASDPQLSGKVDGRPAVRASDKGFLPLSLEQYLRLLRWTAEHRQTLERPKVPGELAQTLSALGIEPGMWSDLVWNYPKYFGRSSAAGSPASLRADGKRLGHRAHPGVRAAANCFVTD